MFLKLDPPVAVATHFCVPGDFTVWRPQAYNISYGQNTPKRKRATFSTYRNGLIPKTPFGASIHSTYGIYILAFDIPHCYLYVGIAASGGKKPEGILTRIKKHRVKATASHVGSKGNVCGGVNHTGRWRSFAIDRSKHFIGKRIVDDLPDARLIIGKIHSGITNRSNNHQIKAKLQEVENSIVSNQGGILDRIRAGLWPDGCICFDLINKEVKSKKNTCNIDILLWD